MIAPNVPHAQHGRELDFLSERDRLLLQRKFDVADPESLQGLVARLPDGAEMHDILFRYDVTPAGGMKNMARPFVSCAHCHGARHWRGYVIELVDDSLALIGEDCGAKQFGIKFNQVESDFHADRSRQSDLRRLIELRQAIPGFVAELQEFRRAPEVIAYDAYMARLRRDARQLFLALRQLTTVGDGWLICTSYERDAEAEKRRMLTDPEFAEIRRKIAAAKHEGVRRRWVKAEKKWMRNQQPIEKAVEEVIGRLAGGGVLKADIAQTLAQGVAAAVAMIRVQATDFMEKRSDEWTQKTIKKGIDTISNGIVILDRAVALMAEMDRFTSAANLALIAQWSAREVELPQPRVRFLVNASDRTLIDEEDRWRLELPTEWGMPPLPHLDHMRAFLAAKAR